MSYKIQFDNVSFQYANNNQFAIKNINLTIEPGEIILITGPAGSGKTTLCSCINGLVPHYHEGKLQGDVLIGPYNTKNSRIGGLASIVGMVFQDPESQLVTNSVMDEVAFGPENLGVPITEINERVQSALKATRLSGYEEREPHNLSGGEQQACVIAATYAMHPEIYVMDEPLANLDPEGRSYILQLVVQMAQQRGKTLVIVEHTLEDVLPLVDRIILMNMGEIVRDGPTSEILALGDIPGVFKRPDIMRLSEEFKLPELALTPHSFVDQLKNKYTLKRYSNGHYQPKKQKTSEVVIEVNNLSFEYDPGQPTLHNINFKVQAGEAVAILGRNGSGKTTLVRHLIGLNQPDSGNVTILGEDVAKTPTHILARDVGFCFQNPNHQIVSFTVRDEMEFGLKAHNIDPNLFEERIKSALEIVDMYDYLDKEVFDLGKGLKQRLALASVLTLHPKILIFDEPTCGQDPEMIDEIFNILHRLNENGTTILIITHRIDYAANFAQRALVLQNGQLSFDGQIDDLLLDHRLMSENSLELPDLTKLAVELKDNDVSPNIASYETMKEVLTQITEVHHGN
jgi:energy-coupling factor transport system ATP-binding protein